jgi:hypothetical protein
LQVFENGAGTSPVPFASLPAEAPLALDDEVARGTPAALLRAHEKAPALPAGAFSHDVA